MGSRNLRTIEEYERSGYGLRVECQCGRVAILEPRALILLGYRRRQRLSLARLATVLRCSQCGGRPKQIGIGER